MTLTRGQVLTIGPFALVALCYAVAAPTATQSNHASRSQSLIRRLWGGTNCNRKDLSQLGLDATRITFGYGMETDEDFLAQAEFSKLRAGRSFQRLHEECLQAGTSLRAKLAPNWNVIVQAPFVIAGDCEKESLSETYRQTIIPTARALSIQYFDQPPAWPVTILLCSTDSTYRDCQKRLGERERSEYAGYYSRIEHRIVINVATGEGTLAHELTHALAHADFPELPEWLDEGLASLHEECEFSSDGMRLIGLDNWRRAALVGDSSDKHRRSIHQLAITPFAKQDRAAKDYAHARYVCLFLQDLQLLEPFYRKCRSRIPATLGRSSCSVETDRSAITGEVASASLRELFATNNDSEIDARFEDWLRRKVPLE